MKIFLALFVLICIVDTLDVFSPRMRSPSFLQTKEENVHLSNNQERFNSMSHSGDDDDDEESLGEYLKNHEKDSEDANQEADDESEDNIDDNEEKNTRKTKTMTIIRKIVKTWILIVNRKAM